MRIFRIKKNVLACYFRLYCTNKPKIILEEVQKIPKKPELLSQSADIQTDIAEECAKFEERAIKQVSAEKEQDANLRSRLSKECKILFTGAPSKSTFTKCGSIHLDKITVPKASPDWLTYNFEHLQANESDQQCPRPPEQEKCKSDESLSKVGVSTDGTVGGGVKSGGTGGDNPTASRRIVRQEPGKVLLAFIPEEWWRVFIPKTGVTGFGTFLFTFGTFLLSKEYYVLEHYYYHGLSSLLLWALGIKYVGPLVAKYLDKEVDEYETAWNKGRVQHKEVLEESILDELHLQLQMDGQQLLMEAKTENVLLQLEEEYRRRQMYAYEEVKKRLDYQVAVELVRQRIQQKNLIEYVTREVVKAVTPEMQDKLIYYSIDKIIQDLGDNKNKK